MCEKITAEMRKDGAIVLTVPGEEFIDLASAFMDGKICCRYVSKNSKFDDESSDMASEAACNLERLEDIFCRAMGGQPPEKTKLSLVE